jgi:hypothetical protein
MEEINNSLQPLNYHDACDDCGKRTDGLMICTYAHDGSTTKLCPDCIKDSGFCYGCGHYCSGMSDFDFSPIPNYCSNCRDEISAIEDDGDDGGYWPYDDPFDDDDFDSYCEDNNLNDSRNL